MICARQRIRGCAIWWALLLLAAASSTAQDGGVKSYVKDYELKVGKDTLVQKRWYLENELIRIAIIDDPGGAVVEFTNKETGINHVAGDVYKRTVEGKTKKVIGWGWKDFPILDNPYDTAEKMMNYQPYQVEFLDGENGGKVIKVTGETDEQRVERWHTVRAGTAELLVRVRLTNIAPKPRGLYLRWHPYSYASADKFGEAGCVLSPGEGSQVRKIRIGSGWDHWFRTHDGYWMAADFRTGDGLFATFEKEKTPVHFTWTYWRPRSVKKGSVTLETFHEPVLAKPGEFVECSFTYFPFSEKTSPEQIPLGLISDEAERERAHRFLRKAKPLSHLKVFGAYALAPSIQFDWGHRRRDLMGLRDWGFADCAIVGFPYKHLPTRVRMVGGFFDDAPQVKGFPKSDWGRRVTYNISATNQDGVVVYKGSETFRPKVGVPGDNTFDREISIPMHGMPDGTYTLRVEAIDPITRKPFHHHETSAEIIDDRVAEMRARLAKELEGGEKDRPFVTALASLEDVRIEDGVARIPIGVEDGSGVRRQNFPVRLGVPLPQGAFKTDAGAQLFSPDGRPVPTQFRVMNVWPDGSLKWLQADFQADCSADGFRFYRLDVGDEVKPQPVGPPLARETGESIELNTGPMLIRIARKRPTIPGEVFLDRNGDGRFDEDERVLLASRDGDAWWRDDRGRTFGMQLGGEASGMFEPGVAVESNGPLSAIVKTQGWYVNPAGRRPAYGEVRVEVFRGKTFFKVWHQVTFTGNPWHDRLASYGLKVRARSGLYDAVSYDMDGHSVKVSGASSLYQRSSDRVSVKGPGVKAATGERASGALSMRGPGGSMLFFHRELWQMFPKKLSVNESAGELAIHYWPEEAGVHDFGPYEEYWIPSSSSAEACGTGASRTEELIFDFSGKFTEIAATAVYDEPVVACTPPKWVQKTKVLRFLQPYDPHSCPEVERYIHLIIDFYDRHRELFKFYGHWDYGTNHNFYRIPLYRWLVLGRWANIGNEENIVQAPWLCYFRSGDRKFLKFARIWTRHLMEVQSIRWNNIWPHYVGMSRRHHYTTWLGGGDLGHTMLCPWLEYYHALGYYPAWKMALATAESMSHVRRGTFRYISNPLIGNIRMYLETGNPNYKATADRIWNDLCYPDQNIWMNATHGSRMCIWYAPFNEDCMKFWKEWCRNGREVGKRKTKEFQYIDTFGALGEMTGDPYYAHKARIAFDVTRSKSPAMLHGDHPAYRGLVAARTQYAMVGVAELTFATGQIAESKRLFPAEYYGLGWVREVVMREGVDQDFSVWLNAGKSGPPKVIGPDRKPATVEVESLYTPDPSDRLQMYLLKLTVKADGRTGFYRIGGPHVSYFGCTLKHVGFRVGDRLDGAPGAPLYVRTGDLGGPNTRLIMTGSPEASLELFSLDGKRLFSETYVRPESDAVGIEHTARLPADSVLRVGDRQGVRFLSGRNIVLYTHPDGTFDLP